MYCENCGAEISKEAYICPKCGVKVKKEENNDEDKPNVGLNILSLFFPIIGLILYLIVSLVFKVAGYKIVMREEMFLIVFIISNVLYYPLVQEFLDGKTLGRKLVQR